MSEYLLLNYVIKKTGYLGICNISLSLIKGYMFYFKQAKREDELVSAFSTLSKQIRLSKAAYPTRTFLDLEGDLRVGTKIKEIVSTDSSGKIITLSSLKGKFVLIDFWASWCVPCRLQIPALKDIYEKFSEKNFTIFGISLDDDKNKWLSALIKEKIPWYNVSDLKGFNGTAAKIYNIHGIPFNILIDSSDNIIAKNIDSNELLKKLSTIIK